ncbi:neuropeptide CCHamide-1 [Cimex lectularius]|uniref:CCHamide n=1 Tax=Cimex lectularius TaxID=79782 RepID=A0A8I6TI45_CIMLE|nr:neuropeptide CCHamide-1 [Cimex lectularius]
MHHAYTLLVMASIVASAPTYASGSCLSYGHSCWGAHGKRSGNDETRWIISKLAPLPIQLQNRQAKLAQILLAQQNRAGSESDEDNIMMSEEPVREEVPEDKQVIIMEQPPRLFQLLKQFPRSLDAREAIIN